jgi:hypothetical protein
MVLIDLDEPGWQTTHAALLKAAALWMLQPKEETQASVLALIVHDGEEPYYVARHLGSVTGGISGEMVAYGIGKKRLDGHTDRLWVLPYGLVCAGDDVEALALTLLRTGGRTQWK